MRLNDAVMGLILGAIALAVLVNIQTFPNIPGQKYGPSAFPGLIAVILLGCSMLLIWRGIKARRNATTMAEARWVSLGAWVRSPAHLLNFLVFVGCLAFYILAADTLGFVITGSLILLVLFLTLRLPLVLALPIAVTMTVLIHFIFYKFLRVPLPWGCLQGMAW